MPDALILNGDKRAITQTPSAVCLADSKADRNEVSERSFGAAFRLATIQETLKSDVGSMNKNSTQSTKSMPPILKSLIDLGPLLLFFAVDQLADIFLATGVLMIAVAVAFAVSWKMTRKIPILPSLTLIFVLIFGGLTLLLGDEEFIKIEVTLTNALCGLFLLAGLAKGKSLLKIAFGEVTELDDLGWRKLTFRMGLFLIFIAATNEMVRHSVPTDLWVMFRVYGILLLTALFFVSQIPLIKRHLIEDGTTDSDL